MNSVKEFKNELRLISDTDVWGTSVEAWFECAGHMNKRGLHIPSSWEYSQGLGGDGTENESYWYELFEAAPDNVLINVGNLLFRYCQFLRYKGKDY
jgi:hypothetical protein